MIQTVLLLLLGLALILFGSDWLVDGSSAIARRLKVSEFVIGLTVVGFGTSCPELVVSLTGAIKGCADISIGNVVGSNILNTILILGLTAVILPIAITDANRKYDLPIMLGVTIFFILLCLKGTLNFVDGIIFLTLFAAYLIWSFKNGSAAEEAGEKKEMNLFLAIAAVIAGLAGLAFGGKLFVDNAVVIAGKLGVSQKFIAVTLLAGGTSLPELATCVAAAIKKKGQLALGNIIGSNIFNILLILGCSALVKPLGTPGMSYVDLGVLLLSALLLFISGYSGDKSKVTRTDGIIMLACEVAYVVFLFVKL